MMRSAPWIVPDEISSLNRSGIVALGLTVTARLGAGGVSDRLGAGGVGEGEGEGEGEGMGVAF